MKNQIEKSEKQLLQDAKMNLASYPDIYTKLNEFKVSMQDATNSTYAIFDALGASKINQATIHMSQMDAQFHQALKIASSLRKQLYQIKLSQLQEYHEKAESIFIKEIYVATFIFVLIGLMLYFGRKIRIKFDVLLVDLEQKNIRLTDSEKKLVSVLDNVLEAIILINSKGIIEYINPQTITIFQYSQKELIGTNVPILMPEPNKSQHNQYIKKLP